MANYAGISYGNEVYCGSDILPILDPTTGTITGTGKCLKVYNSGAGGVQSVIINGNSTEVGTEQTIDVIINTLTWAGFPGAIPEGICIVCTCHDCNNPDGNAQRAVSWPAGTGTTETVINPISPYTLIGMGYLNS